MIEKAIINTEKFKKKFIKKLITMWDFALITSWVLELPNKRIRSFNREKKTLKGTKGVRKEIHSINGTIIKKVFIITL